MSTTTAPTRGLSVLQGAALSTGAVLGTGVITLPALAAAVAGPASLFAWAGLVLLSIPLAATFAALGARFPDAGGVSTYVRAAFGPRAAAVVGWCFYFAVPVGAPPASLMAGGYVSDAVGGGQGTSIGVAAGLIAGVGLMNAFGLRVSGRAQLGLAAALAALLVVTIAVAAPHSRLEHLTPVAPQGWGAVAGAAALLVWAFAGWEAVASLAGEYRRPERDLKRATAVAIAVVGVLYLALATTSVLVLGPAAATSKAPLSDLLALSVGGPAQGVTAVAAVLLTVGAMNAYYAGASRLGAALARDGALPQGLSRGAEPGGVPRRSLAVVAGLSSTALAAAVWLDLGLTPLMLLATGCFTLVYVLGTAAAVRLLPGATWARRGAVVALLSSLALLAVTGPQVFWALGIAAAALAYQWWRTCRWAVARSDHDAQDRHTGRESREAGDVLLRS